MIVVESLEIHVSNHCNLSCRGCSHLTPLEKKCFMDINKTIQSLNLLKKSLHCKVIRLLGGEPTLNPDLAKIAEEIKKIGIADEISLPTNGVSLEKISDDVLKNLDMIEISNYNYSLEKSKKIYEWSQKVKEKYKIKIIIYMYQYFREPYSYQKNNDLELVQKIYKTCIVANKWQCYNVYENYIFKCPEAMALSKNIKGQSFEINGLKITDDVYFEKKLNNYLNNSQCLEACKYCLGTVGKQFLIEQVNKDKYMEYANTPIEELLDKDFLEECQNNDIGDLRTVKKVIEI